MHKKDENGKPIIERNPDGTRVVPKQKYNQVNRGKGDNAAKTEEAAEGTSKGSQEQGKKRKRKGNSDDEGCNKETPVKRTKPDDKKEGEKLNKWNAKVDSEKFEELVDWSETGEVSDSHPPAHPPSSSMSPTLPSNPQPPPAWHLQPMPSFPPLEPTHRPWFEALREETHEREAGEFNRLYERAHPFYVRGLGEVRAGQVVGEIVAFYDPSWEAQQVAWEERAGQSEARREIVLDPRLQVAGGGSEQAREMFAPMFEQRNLVVMPMQAFGGFPARDAPRQKDTEGWGG